MMRSRSLAVILSLAWIQACDGGPRAPRDGEKAAAQRVRTRAQPEAGRTRQPGKEDVGPEEALLAAHHLRWVRGDAEAARRAFEAVVGRPEVPAAVRARAALEAAAILELQGDRRTALSWLERARWIAPSNSELRAEAEKRRAAILSATPLADVPGPAPATVRLAPPARGAAAFRRAERLLVAFYRVVLRPRIETVDRARVAKRRALRQAVAAYERVTALGKSEAALAARCRLGAMYQHMAEALAFDRPKELLPAAARRLSRELREESASNLRKALASYRAALKMSELGVGAAWLKVARREARTLARVLEPAAGEGKEGRLVP